MLSPKEQSLSNAYFLVSYNLCTTFFFCDTVGFFRPLLAFLWKFCSLPVQLCSSLTDHAVYIYGEVYEVLEGIVMVMVNRTSQVRQLVTRVSKVKTRTTEVSIWTSIWKDLFSKIN